MLVPAIKLGKDKNGVSPGDSWKAGRRMLVSKLPKRSRISLLNLDDHLSVS